MVLLAVAGLSASYAQSAPPVIEISALRLGDMDLPPLFYAEVLKDAGGKEVTVFRPLEVGDNTRGGVQKIPLLQPLRLYIGDPQVRDGKGMKPWQEVPVRSAGGRMMVLFYFDSKGEPAHRFLDDSATAHPASSVRIVNCSDEAVGLSLGGQRTAVPPGKEAISVPALDAQGRFDFAFFSSSSVHPVPKRLYFPGKAGRLLVVYSLVPKVAPTGETLPSGSDEVRRVTESQARRLFDQAPEK